MWEQMKLKMKIRLALQLQYYRILFLFGLKSEEIYYIGGSEALPTADERRRRIFAGETFFWRCSSTVDANRKKFAVSRIYCP